MADCLVACGDGDLRCGCRRGYVVEIEGFSLQSIPDLSYAEDKQITIVEYNVVHKRVSHPSESATLYYRVNFNTLL